MAEPLSIFGIEPSTNRLAVKLSNRGEQRVQMNHPWIFDRHIVKISDDGNPGDLAIIFGKTDNKMMGIGLYDPGSPIRIKMIHFGGQVKIDGSFFKKRILSAFGNRSELLKTDTNSYRLLFGENDGFPGLIADVYAECLVLKLYSEIWLPWLDSFLGEMIELTQCRSVVLRLSRIMASRLEGKFMDGSVIYGDLKDESVLFREHGLDFSANVIKGHKTGYFLDHRHNRKRVGELSSGKRVLDVFAYSGGFSVHALAGGATEVCSVDISAQALGQAGINASLNSFAGEHKSIQGDAFGILNELRNEGQAFDIVVIDPPSFAKKESEVKGAKRKYNDLVDLGVNLVSRQGILVMASCSSRISSRPFFDLVETRIKSSGRSYEIMERSSHDVDHPVNFPEGAYLKCVFCKLD